MEKGTYLLIRKVDHVDCGSVILALNNCGRPTILKVEGTLRIYSEGKISKSNYICHRYRCGACATFDEEVLDTKLEHRMSAIENPKSIVHDCCAGPESKEKLLVAYGPSR
jgi:hypothetical protein